MPVSNISRGVSGLKGNKTPGLKYKLRLLSEYAYKYTFFCSSPQASLY